MSDTRSIGVFDSGVGGISVLRELVKELPQENFIYFGDSANAPYGTKPFSEVERLTCEIADRLVAEDVKALVIACNTATAAAVHLVRAAHPEIPVIGIEPALKPAVLHRPNSLVVVLATEVTLAEDKFLKLMNTYRDQADIRTIGCPDIVTHVEAGDTDSQELKEYLVRRLELATSGSALDCEACHRKDASLSERIAALPHIDSVVLGCTHYPFVAGLLQEILGDDCFIIDGGAGTARETRHQLALRGWLNESSAAGKVTLRNSDASKLALAGKLFHL